MPIQTIYQKAIKFAAQKHTEAKQTIPGTHLPYVVHISNVAMEIWAVPESALNFDRSFAVCTALLHDTLEDTQTSFKELEEKFGKKTAQSVQALSKNEQLPKSRRLADSLSRIKRQPKEVWAVKLADRITNLQKPPKHWSAQKIKNYLKDAELISESLKNCNACLENRIQQKIQEYRQYVHY